MRSIASLSVSVNTAVGGFFSCSIENTRYRVAGPRYTEVLLSSVPQPDPDAKRNRIVPKGEVPSPTDRPPGCHFSNRCHYATDLCRTAEPPLTDAGGGRMVACRLARAAPLRDRRHREGPRSLRT
ncbi:oligopeptide/dipeptide ABC transporter ATP-binding protein [Microbacterium amylolyticum]|nr:oligopeptide/dipeptide ABC transporter ATP-binding protein [Microbacterium amylolyticum]